MVVFLLTRKRKNIAVIINASNCNSHLYYGHFVEVE